jgi:hypothetical protein
LVWLLFVGIGWCAVAVLFWCLLVVAARADRQDAADAARTEPEGEPATSAHHRSLPPGRAVVDRSFVTRRSRALRKANEDLVSRARQRR